MREIYRTAIESHGWNFEQFWDALLSAGAPYVSLMQQSARRELGRQADTSQLERQVCVAAVDLLDAAYETFGKQDFNEFLYRTVAPPIQFFVADQVDTATALRRREKGCRE
jgi:hypothetical protein